MAWSKRSGGTVAGPMSVHVFALASYDQVSSRYENSERPPNSMTRSDCESYAIECPWRAAGFVPGVTSVHVSVLKSYDQVSSRYETSEAPPKRMIRSDSES